MFAPYLVIMKSVSCPIFFVRVAAIRCCNPACFLRHNKAQTLHINLILTPYFLHPRANILNPASSSVHYYSLLLYVIHPTTHIPYTFKTLQYAPH